MRKFIDQWHALPGPKQVAAILVAFLLAFSLYSSIGTVLVWPVIHYLQQDANS